MTRVSPTSFVWGENPNWANANKSIGAYSLTSGLIGTACGCVKACTNEEALLNRIFSFIQSVAYGFRNYFQYNLYSRKEDDDLGEDLQKRKNVGKIGEVGCFIEKRINPFALPITNLLGNRICESYNSIAHLANALWWRTRLFSNGINWKFLNKEFINNIRNLFNEDIEERKNANLEIKEIIPPICGLAGVISLLVFTPFKSWNKLNHIKNRVVDLLSSTGTTTQHIAYLIKFSLPELWKSQEENKMSSKILAATGLCANTLNIALPLVELLPSDNSFLGTFHRLYQELATGFTAAFFSTRRHFMGKEWLERNGEAI